MTARSSGATDSSSTVYLDRTDPSSYSVTVLHGNGDGTFQLALGATWSFVFDAAFARSRQALVCSCVSSEHVVTGC